MHLSSYLQYCEYLLTRITYMLPAILYSEATQFYQHSHQSDFGTQWQALSIDDIMPLAQNNKDVA